MKKSYLLLFYLLIPQILSTQRKEITFTDAYPPPKLAIDVSDTYIIKAKFTKTGFLKIYPEFYSGNAGIYKLFFKKYIENDDEADIFNSDYFTLEVNSGLLIDATKLDYEIANIFVYVYGSVDFLLFFSLTDELSFPVSTLINQFLLLKNQEITFSLATKGYNEALTIISKNSLRNIDITITNNKKEDITFKDGGFYYPNGYSYHFE